MNSKFFIALLLTATLFASCELGVQRPGANTAAAGTVTLHLAIGSGEAAHSVLGNTPRSVLPAVSLTDVTRYELRGGKTSHAETALIPSFTAVSGTTVSIDPGAWDFTLNAYKDNNLILQGKIANKTISASSDTLAFTLFPLNSGQGSHTHFDTLPG